MKATQNLHLWWKPVEALVSKKDKLLFIPFAVSAREINNNKRQFTLKFLKASEQIC